MKIKLFWGSAKVVEEELNEFSKADINVIDTKISSVFVERAYDTDSYVRVNVLVVYENKNS